MTLVLSNFFFLMKRQPPRSTLFPSTTPSQSEYLYNPDNSHFLALSRYTPVVRYLKFSDFIPPKTVTLPLKLLVIDRKSTRLNSSHANISYAVFCLKKKNRKSTRLNSSHATIS